MCLEEGFIYLCLEIDISLLNILDISAIFNTVDKSYFGTFVWCIRAGLSIVLFLFFGQHMLRKWSFEVVTLVSPGVPFQTLLCG